jgi:hypothetical protein
MVGAALIEGDFMVAFEEVARLINLKLGALTGVTLKGLQLSKIKERGTAKDNVPVYLNASFHTSTLAKKREEG